MAMGDRELGFTTDDADDDAWPPGKTILVGAIWLAAALVVIWLAAGWSAGELVG